jgi:hypothetical protein
MKITISQLKQLIKEELQNVLAEDEDDPFKGQKTMHPMLPGHPKKDQKKEKSESVIQEAGWKYKKAVDQQIMKARNWKDLKEPLGEITEMIDELWRNWYADHIVVRELDPATKVADDVKRKNYRVPDPSGFPKLNLKQEGYPGLQGEDVTTVANGPPRKK